MLSATLAWAAELALSHGHLSNQSLELVLPAEPAPATAARAGRSARPSGQWVLLASDGESGNAIACLAPSDGVSADVLNVRPADLAQVATALCQTLREEATPDRVP